MAKSLYVGVILDIDQLTEITVKLQILRAKDGEDYHIGRNAEKDKWLINIFSERCLVPAILDRTVTIERN